MKDRKSQGSMSLYLHTVIITANRYMYTIIIEQHQVVGLGEYSPFSFP